VTAAGVSYALRSQPLPQSQARSFWRPGPSATMFAALLLTYLTTGALLAYHGVVYGDALSRVASAQRVLFSRDPHLGAIGFVWSPLPVVALLPIVPFKFAWPDLTTLGLAGSLVSAACMAGAVLQVRGILKEAGVGRRSRAVLTAAFALHPLVFLFGANGMSEAMFMVFILVAVRQLARWLRCSELGPLVYTGAALSMAYLSRYEALPAAVGVVAVVAAVSFRRGRRKPGFLWVTVCDAELVAAPVGFAFVVWAAASWLTVGHPFDQLASIYGNNAQSQLRQYASTGIGSGLDVATLQALFLELFLPLIVIWRLLWSPFHKDPLTIAALAGIGPIVTLMFLADAVGSIDGELRYLILLVPLAVLLSGALSIPGSARVTLRGFAFSPPRALSVLAVAGVVAALPIAAVALLDDTLNPVSGGLKSIVAPVNAAASDQPWVANRQVASDLDKMGLGPGAVLVDDFLGFSIAVASGNPRQFVLTSDRDFAGILSDPAGSGVQYVLVPDPAYLGSLDAVNRQYPSLYATGAGVAVLVRQYGGPSAWRLYRLQPGGSG